MMMTTGTGRSTPGSATGGGGAGGKYPFTQSQWQELEHQALIYKYMAAGMAIPPELLFSIKRNYDSSLSSKLFPYQTSPIGWSPYQMGLGYGGKKIDPEPGRCRRTDGKKWRCSKEAYPDSKYCEKHMHRGKNRSRKPVETTSTLTTNSTVANNNNSLLANSYSTPNNPSSIVSPPSLLSSSQISNKTHHHAASSTSSNSSSTYHSLSSFSPVGLAAAHDTNNSLHYGRPTDHHQHGSSYDVTNAHFLYPHSSSARPPGSNLDLSNQDSSSVHLLFDSGAAASFRDRYAHVMKDEVGGVGGEHAFFTDSSGSMRGFTGASWGNPQQQQQDTNHNLLKMGVAAAHTSLDNSTKQSGGYPAYHLELNKAGEITKQEKQQQLYVWGRDFGSDQQLKMGDTRDHPHHHNPNEANDKTIHHFFDEWPPKEGGNGGCRGGGRDPSSPWHDASTTQLSISMPTPSHDFFLSNSTRTHNES